MSALLITYDLNSPGQKYDDLYAAIKGISGKWCHLVDSTWIVSTTLTPSQVYEKLKPTLDAGDHIFVVDISGSSRQGWLPKKKWEWIRKHS